jgi:hypothetical protein
MSKNLENLVGKLQRGLAAPLRPGLLDMMSENCERINGLHGEPEGMCMRVSTNR